VRRTIATTIDAKRSHKQLEAGGAFLCRLLSFPGEPDPLIGVGQPRAAPHASSPTAVTMPFLHKVDVPFVRGEIQ
jgi:hypothetical protein